MRVSIFGVILFIFFAAGAAGCLGGIGDSCKLDSECRTGLICFISSELFVTEEDPAGTCRRPCHSDEDCEGISICVDGGACFFPSDLEDASTDAEDIRVDDLPLDVPDADARDIDYVGDQCLLPSEFGYIFKMVSIMIGEDGHTGSGLDVDGNPATCAPGQSASPPVCSGGIDNGMAILGFMGNTSLHLAVEEGDMNNLMELALYDASGNPFYVDFYKGDLHSGEPACVDEPGCVYSVDDDSFDSDTCLPVSSLGNAVIAGDALTAGREGDVFMFDALVVGLPIVAPIYRPRIEARVQFSDGEPVLIEGIIGGVLTRDDYIGAFEAIPAEDYPASIDKDDMLRLWEGLYASGEVEMDVDFSGDTIPDASTIGYIFSALPVSVSGVTP